MAKDDDNNSNGNIGKAAEAPAVITPAMQEYIEWVNAIKALATKGRELVVDMFELLRAGRDAQTWKKWDPPWQSWDRCLHKEFGVHPQRFQHIENAYERYGRDYLIEYGTETTTLLLRLEHGSDKETVIREKLEELTDERGRPPSAETVEALVRKVQPAPRPTPRVETEASRLRRRVKELLAQIKDLRAEVARLRRQSGKTVKGSTDNRPTV